MFLVQRWQLCFINEEFKNDNGEKWYEEDCGFFSEKEEPLTVSDESDRDLSAIE